MICRLCLQTIDNNNSQPVEESLLKSVKLNINVSKENVMCIECTNGLRAFSNFTPGRACTEDETLPLSDLHNAVKLDPEAIETTTNLKPLMEIKCSFCTKAYGSEGLISLENSKENKFMVNMLERYISETNLKNTEELLACETCLRALEGVLSVILKCLEVEEQISKYIELRGTDDKGQVELKDVQQFAFGPIIKLESESFGANELEDRSDSVQEEYATMAEAEIKCEKEISNTELIIKTEDDDVTSEQNDCDPDIKSEESVCDGLQEPFVEYKSPSEIKIFKCELCSYKAKRKSHLEKHLLIHKSPSEINTFKCEICSYEAKQKSNLKTHLLTHKDPSEIKMFKCAMCSYETKRKCNLERHLLIHKNSSGIKLFKCEMCTYEAKRKCNLERHLLTHKNSSEIKLFKCEMCTYEAKRKCNLKRHLLIHKNSSEIEMFKCEMCTYEANRKCNLKTHLLIHKDPSEIKMFKCETCPYEAKLKRSLKAHLLSHKDPEIKMFKCGMCSYEARQKSNLKRHLLAHERPCEINMFKCEMCSYETRRKFILKKHLLTHKNRFLDKDV